MAAQCTVVSFGAGETVLEANDTSGSMLLVITGSLHVQSPPALQQHASPPRVSPHPSHSPWLDVTDVESPDGWHTLGLLRAGDTFGEAALMLDAPTPTRVRAAHTHVDTPSSPPLTDATHTCESDADDGGEGGEGARGQAMLVPRKAFGLFFLAHPQGMESLAHMLSRAWYNSYIIVVQNSQKSDPN